MTQPVRFSTVARMNDEPLPGVAMMKMQRDAASCAVSKAWMIIKGSWDLLGSEKLRRWRAEQVSSRHDGTEHLRPSSGYFETASRVGSGRRGSPPPRCGGAEGAREGVGKERS